MIQQLEMHPSQPGTQIGTLPYNRTLFKCTGQGRKISTKDTCTFFGSASSVHCCLKQPRHTLPSRKWRSSALKVVRLLFLPPWGKASPELPTWTIRNCTLEKKCGFPGPKSLPYPVGVAAMREAMKGKGWFMLHLPMCQSAGPTLRVHDQYPR